MLWTLAGAAGAAILNVLGGPASGSAASSPPHPTGLRCLDRCAGRQTAAVGALVRITGRNLSGVSEVDFRGEGESVSAPPTVAGSRRLEVKVPSGARTGRPRLLGTGGSARVPEALRIVRPGRLPARGSFELLGSRVRPHKPFVDARGGVRLRYRFRSYGPLDVRVKLVRGSNLVREWVERARLPFSVHRLKWNGIRERGGVARPGRYRFKLKTPSNRPRHTRRFRLYDGKFPVRGPHGYGGAEQRFGAPRSGGRVHQGQDVFAACGTRVVAARGGHVQARGYDPELYGNWVVIDGRGTHTDYRYAHFLHPASVYQGDRVHTGQRIGRIGKTGNARHVGCMLHLELWPSGWEIGSPIDPLPFLRRWDRWS